MDMAIDPRVVHEVLGSHVLLREGTRYMGATVNRQEYCTFSLDKRLQTGEFQEVYVSLNYT